MYLEKDYFLNEYRKDLKSDAEIREFILTAFPDTILEEIQGSCFRDVLSFFGFVCYPFCISELTTVLGSFLGSRNGKKRIERYIANKVLSAYSFKRREMGCLKSYYISPSHEGFVESKLSPFLRGSLTYRRCGGVSPMHDYGIGMSILQFMLIGKPLYFDKEVVYSMSYKKSKGSLCVDAVIGFGGDDFKIFLEQDMGTEKPYDLVSKLYLYYRGDLSRDKGCVLFSSHNPMNYSNCISFMRSKLEPLYDFMVECKIGSFYMFYELYREICDKVLLEVFYAVAVRVGFLLAYEGDSKKRLDASEITDNTRFVLNEKMDSFTIEDFRRYIDELFSGNNPYCQRMFNREQMKGATFKFRGMCEILCSYIMRGAYEAGEVMALLSHGFSCLVYPTVLLSRSYEYMKFAKRDEIMETLRLHYPGIDENTYAHKSPYVNVEGLIACMLRNCYTLPNGTLLCVEHIGYDVGAFIRFFYLYKNRDYLEKPIHLIGLVENEDQMIYFAKMAGMVGSPTSIKTDTFSLLFYMYNQPDMKRLIGVNKETDSYSVKYLLNAREYDIVMSRN